MRGGAVQLGGERAQQYSNGPRAASVRPPALIVAHLGAGWLDGWSAGREAAEKAARAFAARGLEVRTFFPVDAKDFNAELMEARRA